jgi:hypothetical protein
VTAPAAKATPASHAPLIPAAGIAHVLRGLGVASDIAEVAPVLPPCLATVISGAVRVACVLNDGAWEASTALNDEEQCDTIAVLAAWHATGVRASAALSELLAVSLSPHGHLFPRGTDTEAAFGVYYGVLDAAVTRRVGRRREYDDGRRRRLEEVGRSAKTASTVASAVGLGATVLSFCAGASFLPGLLLARSVAAVAGSAGVVKSIAGSVPTLAQVRSYGRARVM